MGSTTIGKRTKEYPLWICHECGESLGRTGYTSGMAAIHLGCGWCKERKYVVPSANYAYPPHPDFPQPIGDNENGGGI